MIRLTEKKWLGVICTPIAIDPLTGIVTVPDTAYLFVKQEIQLISTTPGVEPLEAEIARVVSPTQVRLQVRGGKFKAFIKPDPAFNGGKLAVQEQERGAIGGDVVTRNVYAEEPIIALRTIGVNRYGTYIDDPAAQIEELDPDVVLKYGPSLEVIEIREFAPGSPVGAPAKSTILDYGPSLEVLSIRAHATTVVPEDLP